MVEVKLSKDKKQLEVFDDDGIYWYSITPTEMQELGVDANEIMTLHSFEPHECCYGCATQRSACTNPNGENYRS